MAVEALLNATNEIITELQTISGIRRVPNEIPENNDLFPFLVAWPDEGVYTQGPAQIMKCLANIRLELHISREDLPRDYRQVMKLIDEIPYQLMKHRNDGGFSKLATFGEITFNFEPLMWANVKTLGVIYIITGVKVETEIT